ncbi:MAG: efflux RND transporter periplasmic adaptor subunit [Phycisphaeraceae bacterium]|nr:efflux RND transporter periplasmic adaptor subunit [Phycisphaeraceae bacterium]
MKAFLKWFFIIFLVFTVILVGAGAFLYPKIKKLQEQRSGGQGGSEVLTVAVEPDRLVRTISAPGDVEPRRKVNISARVSAQITELPFKEGDFVHEGDVIVRLDDKFLKAELESNEASLRATEARLEGARATFVNATSDWERTDALFKTNDVSKAELDTAEARLRQVESELRAAEENVEVARAGVTRSRENLGYTVIRAPMDGRITRRNSEVGETVTGSVTNFGTVILEMADLTEMLVNAQIDESDIAPVRIGQTARVHINAFDDKVFEGTVESIALQHSIDPTDRSKYYKTEVLLHLDENEQIFAGLTANVDVEVETLEGVIKIPSQAVIDKRVDELPEDVSGSEIIDRNKTFARVVFILKDGKAVETPVKIGPSDLTATAVLAGLDPGAEVIVGPWKTLQELNHNKAVHKRKPKEDEAKEDAAPADDAIAGAETDNADDARVEKVNEQDNDAPDGSQSDAGAGQPEATTAEAAS